MPIYLIELVYGISSEKYGSHESFDGNEYFVPATDSIIDTLMRMEAISLLILSSMICYRYLGNARVVFSITLVSAVLLFAQELFTLNREEGIYYYLVVSIGLLLSIILFMLNKHQTMLAGLIILSSNAFYFMKIVTERIVEKIYQHQSEVFWEVVKLSYYQKWVLASLVLLIFVLAILTPIIKRICKISHAPIL